MTTKKEVEVIYCQWFHSLRDVNVCLIDGYDINDDTRARYCAGNWRECELCQKEKSGEPLLKERIGD